jgi:hypothetical protein
MPVSAKNPVKKHATKKRSIVKKKTSVKKTSVKKKTKSAAKKQTGGSPKYAIVYWNGDDYRLEAGMVSSLYDDRIEKGFDDLDEAKDVAKIVLNKWTKWGGRKFTKNELDSEKQKGPYDDKWIIRFGGIGTDLEMKSLVRFFEIVPWFDGVKNSWSIEDSKYRTNFKAVDEWVPIYGFEGCLTPFNPPKQYPVSVKIMLKDDIIMILRDLTESQFKKVYSAVGDCYDYDKRIYKIIEAPNMKPILQMLSKKLPTELVSQIKKYINDDDEIKANYINKKKSSREEEGARCLYDNIKEINLK